MRISPADLEKLFERLFKRGAVIFTQMYFSDGTSKRKYLIVLNHDPAEPETLLFLTTSKVGFYEQNPSFREHIKIKAGVCDFFASETVINCRGVQSMPRAMLKKRYLEKKLNIVGELPSEIMGEIDKIVTVSRFIMPRHKKAILGWK